MLTLNIVGGGRLGQTLGRLWHDTGVCRVEGVLNTTPASAERAVSFVGGGRAVSSYTELGRSDVTLIGVADDAIEDVCQRLVDHGLAARSSTVFHCSGGLSSDVLAPAAGVGARTASVHPVKSFADPSLAVASFAGTYCGIEGETRAVSLLKGMFEKIDAQCFDVDPRYKTQYHAASVMVCNYLVCLMELGFQLYARAGVTRSTAARMVRPIMQETLENVLEIGTAQALTGPIARGDIQMVERHLDALRADAPHIARIYAELGLTAVELSRESGEARVDDPDALKRLLLTRASR